MKHTTLDCYGANINQLDDMKLINQLLNEIVYKMGLEPICPPHIIPYYYGKVKEDLGISAYVLLKGGHLTIHTFPIRECYFVDLFTTNEFDENQLVGYFYEKLPFNKNNSIVNTKHRVKDQFEILPYDATCDFGPHLMVEIKSFQKATMESIFDFLENTAYNINMDPIIRPAVVKSTIENPEYLSGVIIIAQSHISLHYSYETGIFYADIFSCAPFDYSVVEEVFKQLGQINSYELVARGTKHIYKVKSSVSFDDLAANTKWQRVIKNN